MTRRERPEVRYVGSMLDLLTFIVLAGVSLNLLSHLVLQPPPTRARSDLSAAGGSDGSLLNDSPRQYREVSRALESAKLHEKALRREREGLGHGSAPSHTMSASQRMEDLDFRAAEIRRANEALRARLSTSTNPAHGSLARQVETKGLAEIERLEDECRRLQAELAQIGPKAREAHRSFGSTSIMRNDIEATPIHVCLYRGRLLLLQEPDFEWNEGWLQRDGEDIPVLWAERKGSGIDLDLALRDGSTFSQILEALQPDREYLSVFVDGISFGAFRTLRESLRRRGIPFGWEPCRGDTLVFGTRGRRLAREFNGWPDP